MTQARNSLLLEVKNGQSSCLMNKGLTDVDDEETSLQRSSHFVIDESHVNWLGSIHGAELQGFPRVFRETDAGGKVIGGAQRYDSHGK